jgi:hypothetical protein
MAKHSTTTCTETKHVSNDKNQNNISMAIKNNKTQHNNNNNTTTQNMHAYLLAKMTRESNTTSCG